MTSHKIILWIGILLLTVKMTFAALIICVHANAPTNIFGRDVIGFTLMNEDCDEVDHYDTFYNKRSLSLGSGGWTVKVDAEFNSASSYDITGISLSSSKYGDVGPVMFARICPGTGDKKKIYFGFINNDNGSFIAENFSYALDKCYHYSMGTDTITCENP